MNRFIDFIAHHNAVPIVLGILFLASGTALAASPEVRDAVGDTVIGGVSTETVGVDNNGIMNADLAHFSADMEITGVTEDADDYFVAYRYRTYSVVDSAWQETVKTDSLTVPKNALAQSGQDLKTYATEQLREVVAGDLAYLTRVQTGERANGPTTASIARKYSGLVGAAVAMTDAILPPVPIREPAVVEPKPPAQPHPVAQEQKQAEPEAVKNESGAESVATSSEATSTESLGTTDESSTTPNSDISSTSPQTDSTASPPDTSTDSPAQTPQTATDTSPQPDTNLNQD